MADSDEQTIAEQIADTYYALDVLPYPSMLWDKLNAHLLDLLDEQANLDEDSVNQ